MNPQELLEPLTKLLGPEAARTLVYIAGQHKVSGARYYTLPSHVIVLLAEAASRAP
jgi:hypothetical protein